MNAYRVALILCRAVAIALWWMAGIRVVPGVITLIVAQLGLLGTTGFPLGVNFVLPSLTTVIPLAIGAIFLQVFAASLAASIIGSSSFEGETIASHHALEAPEKALASAGAGLFLLFFGAASVVPFVLLTAYTLLFEGVSAGTGSTILVYQTISNLVPAVLQCLVGFVLAFLLGLRRLMKSAE